MASKSQVSAAWRKILCGIPGYDPFAQADGCWFDEKIADKALRFARSLKYTEGKDAGQPFVPSPFQEAIIANLFGWQMKDPDTGATVRRYREILLYIPRGNGKTVFAAVLCLIVLFLDKEPGMQVYGAAASRDQAGLLYRHAKAMVNQAPALDKRAKIYDATKCITLRLDPLSFYRAIAAEAPTSHGFKAHAAFVDELHALPNRELVDVLKSSMGTRTQPITFFLTTADWMRESICNEVYEYACRVRDNSQDKNLGTNDPRFLPVIFEAQKDDDWKSEAVWAKANPNLGVSVKLSFLRDECKRACEVPAYENTFRRLYLNQRTEQDTRAIPMDQWGACGREADPLEWRKAALERLRGKQCFAGLDLGATNDLTALVLLFYDEKPYAVLPFFWATEDAVERRRKNRVPYDLWVSQGLMTATEGNVTDYDVVRTDVNKLADAYGIRDLAIDRLFQGAQLATQLMADGLNVTAFGQGFASMAAPAKRLLELIAAGELDHGNNPVLTWMAGNASSKQDPAGNIKFDKSTSGDKIDGIVALTMAVGRAELTLSEADSPTIFTF